MMSPSKRGSRQPPSASSMFAAGLAVAALGAVALAQPAGVGAAAKLSSPVIHELFTPLPCPDAQHPATTLEMEGCAEHEIARTDTKIDAVAKAIFARLNDDAARRRFVKAQKAWFVYRNADCDSVSDKNEGGTLAAVTRLRCAAERNAQHLKEIRAFDRLLRTEG